MAIAAHYQAEMSAALPGQISDTSRYNVDGACVLTGDTVVKPGYAVHVNEAEKIPGHKVVKAISEAGNKPYGVAIRSHFMTKAPNGEMFYELDAGINVMTVGRVWMVYEGNDIPAFGSAVKISQANGAAKGGGEINTTWTYAGGYTTFKVDDKTTIKLVEVQLHQM